MLNLHLTNYLEDYLLFYSNKQQFLTIQLPKIVCLTLFILMVAMGEVSASPPDTPEDSITKAYLTDAVHTIERLMQDYQKLLEVYYEYKAHSKNSKKFYNRRYHSYRRHLDLGLINQQEFDALNVQPMSDHLTDFSNEI
ncbi:MAG: hypothetical protein KDD40_12565, partial [Bdellovibrionales bacterium]|nr:hypothetical protein [Bdellovibrionales bacterium]